MGEGDASEYIWLLLQRIMGSNQANQLMETTSFEFNQDLSNLLPFYLPSRRNPVGGEEYYPKSPTQVITPSNPRQKTTAHRAAANVSKY